MKEDHDLKAEEMLDQKVGMRYANSATINVITSQSLKSGCAPLYPPTTSALLPATNHQHEQR